MYPRVKLIRRVNKQEGREYPVYFVYLPRKVVEALGDVKEFEVRLRTVDGKTSIVLYPVEAA